jgi:Zn-finger nucleic acid-binding protein
MPLSVAEVAAHGCRTCGGAWLDRDANLAVVHSPDDAAVNAFRSHSAKARRPVDQAPDGLSCPVCNGTLRRHRIEGAWLDVDICDAHGTWYDRGEIERVIVAMQRTGADDWRPLPQRSGSMPTPDRHEDYLDSARNFAEVLRHRNRDLDDGGPAAWAKIVNFMSEDD